MIRLSNLNHRYEGAPLIKFNDWEIGSATKWLLLGNSGSGKTTLLHMMAGILRPLNGEILINGTDILKLSARELDTFRGRHIGLVFQRPHLIKSLTVSENLLLAQTFSGLKKDNSRILEVATSLNIAGKLNAFPEQLSQGQLQRVSIARAMVNQPSVLIADEPTSSLDDNNAAAVLKLLFEQSEHNGTTLVIATHDQRVKREFKHIYDLS